MKTNKIMIDTNILIYLSNKDSEYYGVVQKQINDLSTKFECYINSQIIREYAVSITRIAEIENPNTSIDITLNINQLLSLFELAQNSNSDIEVLFNLVAKYNLKGKRIHDANIIANMISNGISYIFTHNTKDFSKFSEIEIIPLVKS